MARPTYIYSFAASLDGFIADPKGGVKWLDAFHDADYGLEEFFRSIDAVVMGRKTYEVGMKLGGVPSMGKRTVVLSKKMKPRKGEIEIWSGSVKALAKDLERQGAKRVWVMGGGLTASAFLDAGLLDELEIASIPIVLGTGIPMFSATKKPVRFALAESKPFPNGVVLRHYRRVAAKAAAK